MELEMGPSKISSSPNFLHLLSDSLTNFMPTLFRLWACEVLVQMVRLVKHPENTMMMCPSQTFAADWYWNLWISLCLWWLLGAYPIASLGSLSNNNCSSASPSNKTLHHSSACCLICFFLLNFLHLAFLLLLLMICLDFTGPTPSSWYTGRPWKMEFRSVLQSMPPGVCNVGFHEISG